MANCATLYKSRKVQSYLKAAFKTTSAQMIQQHGKLPAHYSRDFKNGFKKQFMENCMKKQQTMNKNKSKTRKAKGKKA